HLTALTRRFINTLFVMMIDFANDRLFENGHQGVYYMKLDEFQEQATRRISDILGRKRKTGLRLELSHHHLGQLEDKRVHDDVANLTKTKIAFYIPDSNERMKVVKMMYGGDLPDRDVAYVLGQMKKQHAVIKKGKEAPAVVRIPDVEDVDISKEGFDVFIEEI